MTKTNVVRFPAFRRYDISADQIIADAPENMQGVIIIGYDEGGEEYFASSYADGAEAVWLMERAKLKLLRIADEDTPGV